MVAIITKTKKRIQSIYKNLSLQEISGSLGDMGTLLPLLVALSAQRSIALAPALFFGGLTNFITGFFWDVPMCVQPMKSISAVALSESWNAGRVTASGIWMGVLMTFLGATSLIEIVNKIVPGNCVSGLQIGVGIRLASKGINMVAQLNWVDKGLDCILLSLVCALLCMYWLNERRPLESPENESEASGSQELGSNEESDSTFDMNSTTETNEALLRPTSSSTSREQRARFHEQATSEVSHERPASVGKSREKKHPVGIYLFLIGALFAGITLGTAKNDDEFDLPLRFFGAPIAMWTISDISIDDWKYGFLEGAIPQLPLTTLNSVISVCALAHSLYPEKRKQSLSTSPTCTDAVISRREVAISVGLMNLVFCPFGSMPNCHGAGGLAGQHRLGARHGASVVFLGLAKMFLAIFFGASALTLLDAFPDAVLGIMLVIAGQELATTGFTLLVRANEDAFNLSTTSESLLLSLDDSALTKEKTRRLRQNTVIAVITALVIISLGKTHYGALSGFVAHMIYGDGYDDLMVWISSKRRRRESRVPCEEGLSSS
ncbi:hypothetical protein CTEN210_02491 [Chaetoceros tenuissimus]|uniref:Sulfate transporter n=1 Tax=Chaetoceros tenuissimus TaxID=426638 RepID=A0AAD3CH55_9STRA|nr:hypothetical protein CTEN210_02491 [Chaetoceros tenuissimus]